MRLYLIFLALHSIMSTDVPSPTPSQSMPESMLDYLQCQVCTTPHLSGDVRDSCCDYETVDKALDQHFHPLLQELTQMSFFRYFKVNLEQTCAFWSNDDGMCALESCAVSVCELPPDFFQYPGQFENTDRKTTLSKVDRKANMGVGTEFSAWSEAKDMTKIWIDQHDHDMIYVNLMENQERFTGYTGYQASRIWSAIYDENCFQYSADQCLEKRVYYRLISGLQASINTHIAQEYQFPHAEEWQVNTPLYVERVGSHPQRLQNLYFLYLFVMRALGRAKDVLLMLQFESGNAEEDARTRELMVKLLDVGQKTHHTSDVEGEEACSVADRLAVLSGFDETTLFQDDPHLEDQFRAKFQNISRIMDCVTCEKCQLWGKVQVMGIGVAIKILFAENVQDVFPLQKNEIVAFIQVLTRLSESVDAVRLFRQLEFQQALGFVGRFTGLLFVVLLWGLLVSRQVAKRRAKRRHGRNQDKKAK